MPATLTRTTKHIRQDLHALDQRERTAREEAAGLYAKARGEGRQLTDAEKARDVELKAQLGAVTTDRESLREELSNAEALARIECASPRIESVREGWREDPKGGYANAREMIAEMAAAVTTGRVPPRLAARATRPDGSLLATAGSDEHSTQADPYGGFLIPRAALAPGVLSLSADADPIGPLTRKIDLTGVKSVKLNARVDKDHSTSVTGGLVVYRRIETQAVTASRTQFEQVELEKSELMGTTFATEELLATSPVAFASLLAGYFGEEFDNYRFNERLNGTGAGRMQGIFQSPALITITKETSQAASTIVFANVLKMIARCWNYGGAYWLASRTCYPQLRQMVQPGSTIPIFATGVPGIATLEGRPIFFHERMPALGSAGDLSLVVPSEYLEYDSGAADMADSVHVRFLERERTFMFWKYDAGACWWRTALTPTTGDTLSPFIRLGARA